MINYIPKRVKKLIKQMYNEMLAEQFASIQPINSSAMEWMFKKIKIPKIYQKILDDIKKIKTKFNYIFYDYKQDKIVGEILLKNFDTYISSKNLENEIIKNRYFDMYKKDIDIIKNICKNNNVNVEFELFDVHCFCYGWCNAIGLTIKRK